jgi:hypothetical protein
VNLLLGFAFGKRPSLARDPYVIGARLANWSDVAPARRGKSDFDGYSGTAQK